MGAGLRAPVAVVVVSAGAQELPREEVRASLESTLDATNAMLESHEKLSHIIVDEESWSIENGLLTPTLKIKRGLLEEKYQGLLAKPQGRKVAWVNE
jgi:long-subunit acyl-CoA synthetase (AMP-forming)